MNIKDYGDLKPNSLENIADFHDTGKHPVRNVKSNGSANREVCAVGLTKYCRRYVTN